MFIRNTVALQSKAPIQLDLFLPVEHGYEFQVIVTNKKIAVGQVACFHDEGGYQEKIHAELESQTQMDCVPCRKLGAN